MNIKKVAIYVFLAAAMFSLCRFSYGVESLFFNSDNIIVRARAQMFHPGEIILFEISSMKRSNIKGLRAVFLDTDIPLYEEGGLWYGMFGVPAKIKPGDYRLKVYVVPEKGKPLDIVHTIKIKERDFKISNLSVDPHYLEYTTAKLKRIKKEAARLRTLWKIATPEKMWNGMFRRPIDSVITMDFAVKRVFNGEYRSFHSGTDLKAAVGTDILATNSGRVVMRDDFYFSGKFIIIDHGRRLYSFYAHLSKFKVKTGDFVNKGDLIAISGDTGRITGPHLHWTMKINSVNVDPVSLTLMELY